MYTLDQFSQLLLRRFPCFIEDLYSQGARRIGAMGLPPVGCLPAPINLYGGDGCISSINTQARDVNRKLNSTASSLSRKVPGLNLVIQDNGHLQATLEVCFKQIKDTYTKRV